MANDLTAGEAATRLGVTRQTLYAYVSRGFLRAQPAADGRESRYSAEAVDSLAANRRRGRRPKEIAKATLDWGLPVLESSITLIEDGQLFYRGENAVGLAETSTVEAVAALLWQMPVLEAFPAVPPKSSGIERAKGHDPGLLLQHFAAATEDDETAVWRQDAARLAGGCGNLVRSMLACITGQSPDAASLPLQAARAWRLDDEQADLIRAALILCADHELNASGFTARCVASTGSSLRGAVIAGLAALAGVRHGGATQRLEALWDSLAGHAQSADLIRRRLTGGENMPGFGHPLYPKGDIRASALLARILPRFPEAWSIMETVETLTGARPTIDFALVALRRHLRLAEGHAFSLFALGRSIGWIAQALEQRTDGRLIRPRAIYVGKRPNAQ